MTVAFKLYGNWRASGRSKMLNVGLFDHLLDTLTTYWRFLDPGDKARFSWDAFCILPGLEIKKLSLH